MLVTSSIDELRSWLRERRSGRRIGFVPTMGALHDGHMALVEKAQDLSDDVVMSIFVNPTQFGPKEDLSRYPRPIEEDLRRCREAGVAAVFTPQPADMYLDEQLFGFTIAKLADYLCGPSRPGHFEGVVQVVNKLFNIVEPDIAVFGQKDFQQFRILERMVEEFNHGVQMVMHPTVRESDGLAMSSRNRYLSAEERGIASRIHQTLVELETDLRSNPHVQPALAAARDKLQQAGFKIDYIYVVSNHDLQPLETAEGNCVAACAVYLGTTRLIDNRIIDMPATESV